MEVTGTTTKKKTLAIRRRSKIIKQPLGVSNHPVLWEQLCHHLTAQLFCCHLIGCDRNNAPLVPGTQITRITIGRNDDLIRHQRTTACFEPQTIRSLDDSTSTNIGKQLHTRTARDIQHTTMQLSRMNRA